MEYPPSTGKIAPVISKKRLLELFFIATVEYQFSELAISDKIV